MTSLGRARARTRTTARARHPYIGIFIATL